MSVEQFITSRWNEADPRMNYRLARQAGISDRTAYAIAFRSWADVGMRNHDSISQAVINMSKVETFISKAA